MVDEKIEQLTAAVAHAKREFYLRGRRDVLFDLVTAEDRGQIVDIQALYNQAIVDLRDFPRKWRDNDDKEGGTCH